jgi:ABC-type Zn uptake system ZnuABC Zn-binding protein ZnuA
MSLRPLSRRPGLAGAGLALMISAFVLAACSDADEPEAGCSGGDIHVVTTLPLFAEWACEIGGDNVTVTPLVPRGADPRVYQPTSDQSPLIDEAQLVLYNGLGLDQPSLDFVYSHATGRIQIIGYSIALPSPTAEQPADSVTPITADEAGDNPMMWLDIETALNYISSTRDSLQIADPDSISYYQDNAQAYSARLRDLDRDMRQAVEAIPRERRGLGTLYDTFPHLARAYGLQVLGFTAATPQDTPAQDDLDALVQSLAETGVPAVFADRGYDPAPLQQVATAAGVELCFLYSDQFDSDADTFIEMMEANAEQLERCLG